MMMDRLKSKRTNLNLRTASNNGPNNGIMQNSYTGGSITDDAASASDVKPAVSIFSSDYKKHDDLKQMLDSNKDSLKLDAMKRIIGMIAKGRNASDLFPAVVKNVVSKNVEIKKLVYVYLMRYAEEQQDLALLSISTFQRALKDPNQLIRASALRVLSSIRVPIIATIMMLSIKEAVVDMSPFVRKTAANAITKLYSLDPEQKEDLIGIIEKLLADKTILVAGSAIQAFEEVCPERIDLIHKNFRKLVNLLIDVDEWGQVTIINMLTRYARTQFVNTLPASKYDPAAKELESTKAQSDQESSESDSDADYDSKFDQELHDAKSKMDPDLKLLLKNTKPLFQSRNSAAVMAVAQLYYYVAPRSEVQIVAKSLIRLLRSHREVQIIVLRCIVSMAQRNKQLFQNNLKSFFVHNNDSLHVKLLKLEIMTCLANATNISIILREFQTYVLSNDKNFAAASIHAIGRCASTIKEVSDNCLSGLVNLMSKKDETIVAESVVVIKRLLQLDPAKNDLIIKKMAKMTDKISVPMARASIIWLIGEYSDRVNKIAPDVLRKAAKTFCEEENVVKLQIINLAVKLHVSNSKQVGLLVQYILNLAKYDMNYDIRDRARYFRTLINNNEKCPVLAKHLKKIILAPKPAPVLESIYKDSDQYQIGTLSHAIGARVNGYADLPEFPGEAPDPTVRNVELPVAYVAGESRELSMKSPKEAQREQRKEKKLKEEKFYSDDESESQSTEGADPTNDEDESSSSESRTSDTEENTDKTVTKKLEKKSTKKRQNGSEDESSSDSDEDSSSSSGSESTSDSDEEKATKKKPPVKAPATKLPSRPIAVAKKVNETEDDSECDSESESESSSSKSESESEPEKTKKPASPSKKPTKQHSAAPVQPKKSGYKPAANKEVSLLDLDFSESMPSKPAEPNSQMSSVLSPSLMDDLANLASSSSNNFNLGQAVTSSKKEYELLNKINGNGLQINYVFPRTLSLTSNKMTTIELIFKNFTSGDLASLNVVNTKLQTGMSISEFQEIDILKNETKRQTIGIDFNDTTQSCQFELNAIYSNDPSLGGTSVTKKWNNLSIACPVGEVIKPGWGITESEFNKLQAKLKGMNEIFSQAPGISHAQFLSKNLNEKLLESFGICQIPSSKQDLIKYAAITSSSKNQLLLSLFFNSETNVCNLNVNCENLVIANMFIKEVKGVLLA